MKRSLAGRLAPPLLAGVATAVPALTAIEILTHTGRPATHAATLAQVPLATAAPAATRATQPTAATVHATPINPPTAAPTRVPVATAPAARTFTGTAADYQFGSIQVAISVAGKHISNVQISESVGDQHSADVNSFALPQLRTETLSAQSANVNAISGATETSGAYLQSLQSALAQANL